MHLVDFFDNEEHSDCDSIADTKQRRNAVTAGRIWQRIYGGMWIVAASVKNTSTE